MDAETLLAAEREGWDRLRRAFDDVPAARFEEPGVTPDGWSPKDLLFHVVAWLDECAAALERERSGSPEPDIQEHMDVRNARFFQTSRAMSTDEVRSAAEPARERMIASLTALDPITNTGREWFEESGVLHYREHERDLRGWLERGP